jgi:hypothetical protein
MTQLVRNVGTAAMYVRFVRADGSKGSFRLMPRGKGVPLPEGSKIDPYWREMNGKYLRIFDLQKPVTTNPVSQPTVASSANGSAEVKAAAKPSTASVKEA